MAVDVWFLIVSSALANPGMIGPMNTQQECEEARAAIVQGKYEAVCKHAIDRKECPKPPDGSICPAWIFEKSNGKEQ